MYKAQRPDTGKITCIIKDVGEPMEFRMRRILNNEEPIKEGAARIYTERKQGVLPEHDIRTNRWKVAASLTDAIAQDAITKRKNRIEEREKVLKGEGKEPDPKPGPQSDKPSQ